MPTRQDLNTLIDAQLPDNLNKEITAARLRTVLKQLVQGSANLKDDAELFGLYAFDPADSYFAGQAVIYDGQVWQANTNLVPGPWDANNWTLVQGNASLPPGISVWDNAATYVTDDYVEYLGEIYRSLVDNNIGQQPASAPAAWAGVSIAQRQLEPWQSNTWYPVGTVVVQLTRIWQVATAHLSGDFEQDVIAFRLTELSPSTNGYFGTRYNLLPGEVQTVSVRHQYIVHQQMIVDGQLIINGQLVVL